MHLYVVRSVITNVLVLVRLQLLTYAWINVLALFRLLLLYSFGLHMHSSMFSLCYDFCYITNFAYMHLLTFSLCYAFCFYFLFTCSI